MFFVGSSHQSLINVCALVTCVIRHVFMLPSSVTDEKRIMEGFTGGTIRGRGGGHVGHMGHDVRGKHKVCAKLAQHRRK